MIAATFAASQASERSPSPGTTWRLLFAFGALNLGLGLAFFATGARLDPGGLRGPARHLRDACSAPIWVWLVHGEVPSARTIVGGAVVFAALLVHIGLEFKRRLAAADRCRGNCRRPIDSVDADGQVAASATKDRRILPVSAWSASGREHRRTGSAPWRTAV